MSDSEHPLVVSTDLPITLYLNQRLTFDLLASLEGGFSHFTTVHTTTSGETATNVSGETGFGLSNAFALLGVRLGVQGSRQAEDKQSGSTTENYVHTPASLFARLRKELDCRKLIRYLTDTNNLADICPRDFVEFEAPLRRNQFVAQLAAFAELVPLLSAFQDDSAPKNSQQRKQDKNSNSQSLKQVNSLLTALTSGESLDFVSRIGEVSAVITTEQQYFIDPTMNDVIDGTFRVFGKASRVIHEGESGSINLLRKAPLGQFRMFLPHIQEAISQFAEQVDQSMDVATEIEGPAIQIIPLAIYS